MRPEMKFARNEILTHHKINSVYIIFHCGQNEAKFDFGYSEKNGPFSKSQSFLFWWNKSMHRCFLSYNFILGSVYIIFYHMKWNLSQWPQ